VPLLSRTLRPPVSETLHLVGPRIHLPLPLLLAGWLGRRAGRGVVWLCRRPARLGAVAAAAGLLWARAAWGPGPTAAGLGGLVAVLLVWAVAHPASFDPVLGLRARGALRAAWVYRRNWQPALATAGLTIDAGRAEYLPELRSVRSTREVDRLLVRMLPGQRVADYADAADRLAVTFGVLDVRAASTARRGWVELSAIVRDPLTAPVPVPTPAEPVDLRAVEVGRTDAGDPFTLPVLWSHLLVAGETGAGKGSVLWSLLLGLAPAIRDRLVRVWAIDPKGGMELAAGGPLFDRFVYGGPTADGAPWQAGIADLLDDAVRAMQARAARLRGNTRRLDPTLDEPLLLIVVDELASLTAYVTDPTLRKRLADALSLLLSQGRAVGVTVVAATQDARKEVVTMRDLFPSRVALRTAEPAQADLILGRGARDRGARTEAIPDASPGVGYVIVDDRPEPLRVRFAYVPDEAIVDAADLYRPVE